MLKFSFCSSEESEKKIREAYSAFAKQGLFGNGHYVIDEENSTQINYRFQNGTCFLLYQDGYIMYLPEKKETHMWFQKSV